jgi:hypothetical protein
MSGERFDPFKRTMTYGSTMTYRVMQSYATLRRQSSGLFRIGANKEVIMISTQASQLSNPLLHTRSKSNPEARPARHDDVGRVISEKPTNAGERTHPECAIYEGADGQCHAHMALWFLLWEANHQCETAASVSDSEMCL